MNQPQQRKTPCECETNPLILVHESHDELFVDQCPRCNKIHKVWDRYHSLDDLYKHRIHLFIALCKSLNQNYAIIKSTHHDDWSKLTWWFIIQIEHKYVMQISYHLPMEYWDTCYFIESKEKANKWDRHSSDDVLDRLLMI